MDRCRVWEIRTDPAVRRVTKPSPDPIYPAYVVGDADKISETTRVAAVTGQKSGSDQLEDLLRRLLTPVDTPAPAPEVPAMEKLLQRLVAETQSRPPPVVSPPVPTELEQMLRSFLTGQRQRQRSMPRQCVSPVGSRVMQQHDVRTWTNHFRLCSQDGGRRKRRGVYYDPTPGGHGPKTVADLGGVVRLSGQWSRSACGFQRWSVLHHRRALPTGLSWASPMQRLRL